MSSESNGIDGRKFGKWMLGLAMLVLIALSALIIRSSTRDWLIEQQGLPVTAQIVTTDCESGTWVVDLAGENHAIEAGWAADRCAGLSADSTVTLLRIPHHEELVLPGANHRGRWLYGALVGIIGVLGLLVVLFRGRGR